MKNCLSLAIASLGILLAFCPSALPTPQKAPADQLSMKLAVRVPEYEVRASSYIEALVQTASRFQIPLGVEWVDTSAARGRLVGSWKNATVREIFWAIVRKQRGYRLNVADGVVHIYAPGAIPDRQNFLRIKVDHFEGEQQVVELASRRLHDLVKLTVFPSKPSRGRKGVIGSLGVNPEDPKISVRLDNVTIQMALSALALASDRKIWVVTFVSDPSLTATGFRKTRTLWTNSPVPDNEQPVWDLLQWGAAGGPSFPSSSHLKAQPHRIPTGK